MKHQNILSRLSPLFILGVFAVSLALGGCKDDKAKIGDITLNIEYAVGDQDLAFDQMQYVAPVGYNYSVITMRHYLSRIKLINDDGASVDLVDVIYNDAREVPVGTVSLGEVPNDVYTHFEFIFGLDEEMNVDGGLDNTMENINMEWPIPGDQGYHYMKFEGKYEVEPGGELKSFNLHTGATGGNQNYVSISLPLSNMVVDGNNWQLDLKIDMQEWLQNPQMYDFEEFGSAIMMNQAAQEVLKANGQSVFSCDNYKE